MKNAMSHRRMVQIVTAIVCMPLSASVFAGPGTGISVPEPSVLGLIAAGVAAGILVARTRRKK